MSFETVADEYDAGRPSYPAGVYDALGPLESRRVLDVGAGTGIATRQLAARGAMVVAVDPGRALLGRARRRAPATPAIVADGCALPVPDGVADLVCFAQSWHWLDPSRRVPEAHRVLRAGGRWAAWWSHARADGERWFDRYWSLVEAACAGAHRDQRDTDWGATVANDEHFDPGGRVVVPWTRRITIDDWLVDQASHTYVAALVDSSRRALLGDLRAVLTEAFPSGTMAVRYETWLWTATKT